MKVSIIIPMFRCESYVNTLLSSLLTQDFRDFEIICVIDGSPDNTLTLAQEFSKKDERIRVIPKEHGGAGAARNAGMDNARGDYLMFLDADDAFQNAFVGKMVHAMEKSDADIGVCQFDSYNFWNGINHRNDGFVESMLPKGENIIDPLTLKDPLSWVSNAAHNKIYKKSFVVNSALRFSATESINDVFFVNASLLLARRVVLIRESLYTYRQNHNINSITSNRDLFRSDVFTVFHELYTWMVDKGLVQRFIVPFCKRWRGSFHSYARYGVSAEFQNMAVRCFMENEPWIAMDDKTLYRAAGLDTTAAAVKRRLAQMRLKKLKRNQGVPSDGKEAALAVEGAERELCQAEAEIANISAVRHRLGSEYKKNVDKPDNFIRASIRRIEDFGFRSTLTLLLRKR